MYGINPDATKQKDGKKEFDAWTKGCRPFHWLTEFYKIIEEHGGFDVVIGNPPYIAMRRIDYDIKINDFSCYNIFGYIIKRTFDILNKKSRGGFIVMHNLAFSRNFEPTRKTIKDNVSNGWFSFFARIPAGLFSGDVRVRNCIFLWEKGEAGNPAQFHTTRIHRWFAESRKTLFQKLNYSSFRFNTVIPMLNSHELSVFFENADGRPLSDYESKHSEHIFYYKQSAYNWIAVSKEPAPCYDSSDKKIPQSQVNDISLVSEELINYSLLFLNGKIALSYWLIYGDEFHVTKDLLLSIPAPFDRLNENDKSVLDGLIVEFSEGLNHTIQYKLNAGRRIGTYNTSQLWRITDKSDMIFLRLMCDKPEEVFSLIEDHVFHTVISGRGAGEK
jgi:hypothetical protein